VAEVPDDTLAFLFAGPDQQPGDYERHQAQAGEIRRAFVAFCEAQPHHATWRQAWAAFMATGPVIGTGPEITTSAHIIPVNFTDEVAQPIPVTSFGPRWRQRLQAAASKLA
jgi:hypothetical protein